MEVKNRRTWDDIPFADYLKMPGFSFSWLKNNGEFFAPTNKMNLGSQVDNYLNEPERFDGDLDIIKPMAQVIKQRVGDLYYKFDKQQTITADFIHDGMVLNYKGRPDWGYSPYIVIDIKMAENIRKTMYYFRYPDQLTGYARAKDCKAAMILSCSPKTRNNIFHPELINVPLNDNWWHQQILKYGKPYYN